MEQLNGSVERIIYRSASDGWTVMEFTCEEGKITAVGKMPFLSEGESASLSGEWVNHASYGRQFRVDSFESTAPQGAEAIRRYLASGAVKGIGPVTADAIVAAFGTDSLDILQFAPIRLTEIYGIGEKRAEMIARSFAEQAGTRRVMMGLQGFGITLNQAQKIYKLYGEDALRTVQEDPYRLIDDVWGIGFKTADRIARAAGVEESSPFRVRAGIKYVLSEGLGEGHTHLPYEKLVELCVSSLGLETALVERELQKLAFEHQVKLLETAAQTCVYLEYVYTIENDVARRLYMLSRYNAQPLQIIENMDDSSLELSGQQMEAVQQACTSQLLVITGGPGTGKTTILKKIIELYDQARLPCELAAPTGRAAKRMSEASGKDARTIHRLLEYAWSEQGEGYFGRNEDNPLDTAAVILDETSMLDLFLLYRVLKALKKGTRLVLVGDADQLPSLGPGNVLRDIIESGAAPCIRLTEVFRQEGESGIVVNAHRINEGTEPVFAQDGDFVFLPRDPEGTKKTVLELALRAKGNAQVLTPMRKVDLGVIPMNGILQQAMNPPAPGKAELQIGQTVFREGDKVMQIKNNYKQEWFREGPLCSEQGTGVFNGDMGILKKIDHEEEKALVEMDDGRSVCYDFSTMDEVELAYAISVHKSQGSEFDTVIMPVYGGPPMLMTRNMLYTAVTRAKKKVYLVGKMYSLNSMIQNNRTSNRYTNLEYRLRILTDTLD